MYQQLSWMLSLILVGLLAIIFIFIARLAATERVEYASIQKSAYQLRSKLFYLVLLIMIPVIGYSLTLLPYPSPSAGAQVSKTVNAVGHQWYWNIDDLTARVNQPVLYKVTSADVNHGFAIYDQTLNVIAQTQAMPGYSNDLKVTYTKPGVYKILCLEYCGLAHHAMISEITVTE